MQPTYRRTLSLCLLALLMLPLLAGCSGSAYEGLPQKLRQMQQNLQAVDPICDELVQIADWQIDSNRQYWEEYDEAFAQGEEDEFTLDNSEEVLLMHEQLTAQIAALDAIEDSYQASEKATGVEQFDLTEQAYLACMADIRRAAEDMQVIFQYYFDVQEALKPMEEFEPVESTTGYTDYSLIAGQISQVISQTQKGLAQVAYPSYMKDSHDLLLQRISDYQGLSQDLSEAIQINDPLRMASWENRVSRLDIMLTQCSRNLDDDFNLQFGQARERIEGRVETLRTELASNTRLLLDAME